MGPNADFDTYDVNDETVMNSFLLSNIAPQHHGFNGGKSLKEKEKRLIGQTYYSVPETGQSTKSQTTLYSVINTTSGKYCSVAFI